MAIVRPLSSKGEDLPLAFAEVGCQQKSPALGHRRDPNPFDLRQVRQGITQRAAFVNLFGHAFRDENRLVEETEEIQPPCLVQVLERRSVRDDFRHSRSPSAAPPW
jgi:hypothetical protein